MEYMNFELFGGDKDFPENSPGKIANGKQTRLTELEITEMKKKMIPTTKGVVSMDTNLSSTEQVLKASHEASITDMVIFGDLKIGSVEVIIIENNPWFKASDVCKCLDYKNPSRDISRHTDEDDRSTVSVDRGGSIVIINESGLYSLMLRSNKPQAKEFKKWVTSIILPEIRKTGSFSPIIPLSLPEALRAYADEVEKNQKLEEEKMILLPKAELADAALRDKTEHYSITEAGKHLGLRQSEMFKILRDNNLLTKTNLPTQKSIDYNVLILRSNAELGERNHPQSVMTMENMDNFRKRYMK